MSDLLARIARRAVGTGPRLRPRLPARFESDPPRASPVGAVEARAVPPGSGEASPPSERSTPRGPVERALHGATPVPDPGRRGVLDPDPVSPLEPATGRGPVASPAALTPETGVVAPAAATAPEVAGPSRTASPGARTPRSHPASSPGAPAALPTRPSPAAREGGDPLAAPREPTAPGSSRGLDLARVTAALDRPESPPGEPGPAPTPAGLLLPGADSRPVARPSPADRERPRVQVTIERLEVRAAPGPPPARRTPSQARPPRLTLEEYAERRMRQLRGGR